jgi:hypothetical protein
MKRFRILALAILAVAFAHPAHSATDVSVRINLGNAPPPPVFVVQHPPRTVWLPESRVYVVHDADFDEDCFQVGAFWYVFNDGYWYRARSWRGPFTVIAVHEVPHSITVVPARHWRHYPYGSWGRQHDVTYVDSRGRPYERVRVKSDNGRHEGWDKDKGRGHGKGHH